MQSAIKLRVTITKDHVIKLPDELPEGPADIIVLVEEPGDEGRRADLAERRRRSMGSAAGQFIVPEDFDAPLPSAILQHFERGDGDPEGA